MTTLNLLVALALIASAISIALAVRIVDPGSIGLAIVGVLALVELIVYLRGRRR